MANDSGYKVGDRVFVVYQQGRGGKWALRTETLKIHSIGRIYGHLNESRGTWAKQFRLNTGESHHGADINTRANGYGFDVYHSEEEWKAKKLATDEAKRLMTEETFR